MAWNIVSYILRFFSAAGSFIRWLFGCLRKRMPTKEDFLKMPLEKKRRYYRCGDNFTTLLQIPVWQESSQDNDSSFEDVSDFECIRKLNEKISTFQGDITTLEIDVIVNAANKSLRGGGGVDGAIHRAAGDGLLQECIGLNGCRTGQAKISGGYHLPAKYVIHTVGPMEENSELLQRCYENSLNLMKERGLRSIAFPCISTGIYGFPNKLAAKIALETTRRFLEKDNNAKLVDRILFCLFLEKDIDIYSKLLPIYFPRS